jgi:hypothetical protein
MLQPFPGPRPQPPPSRTMATSGTHFVPPPSPSLDPAAIVSIAATRGIEHCPFTGLALFAISLCAFGHNGALGVAFLQPSKLPFLRQGSRDPACLEAALIQM